MRRFSGQELTEIEQNIDRYRTNAMASFYARLDQTIEDALESHMFERAKRAQAIFLKVCPQEYLKAPAEIAESKRKSQEFRNSIMR